MEYKVGEVFKHKESYVLVEEGNSCENCFFNFEDYPYVDLKKKDKVCYRKNLFCEDEVRLDRTNVCYKEISEIEFLILKGEKEL
ncbi:MAG: hypothetical protein ACLT40_00715 [Fusobacterium sp.]